MNVKPEDLGEFVARLGKRMGRPMHPKVAEYFTALGADCVQAALSTGLLIRGINLKVSIEVMPLEESETPLVVGLATQEVLVDLDLINNAGQKTRVDADFANKPISPLYLGDHHDTDSKP